MILLDLKEVRNHGVVVVVGEEEDGEEEVGEDMVVDGDKSPRTIFLKIAKQVITKQVNRLKICHCISQQYIRFAI